MSTCKLRIFFVAAALALLPSLCGAQHPNLGRALSPQEVRALDITIAPDGRGLVHPGKFSTEGLAGALDSLLAPRHSPA